MRTGRDAMTKKNENGPKAKPVRLAGRELGPVRHICAFFNSKKEEYDVLLSFIKEGIECGDKACHIVDADLHQDHLLHLTEAGIDCASTHRTGQLDLRSWEQAYLRDGHFDQDRMIALIQEVLKEGRAQGFPLTRLVANMEWALLDRPGVNNIVEYESRLNEVLPGYDDPVVCTYDLSKFSAGVVIDILRTHPMVIIGGIVQENPFYVSPDRFLRELSERRGEAVA